VRTKAARHRIDLREAASFVPIREVVPEEQPIAIDARERRMIDTLRIHGHAVSEWTTTWKHERVIELPLLQPDRRGQPRPSNALKS
jgi:hypothetical protein